MTADESTSPSPRADSPAPRPDPGLGAAAPVGIPKILIVDDCTATANALAMLLGRANFATAVSHRGGEALELARTDHFAAAVVDIHLPDLSGLVVSQKLRERFGPEMPIIVLSGDTSMQTLNSLPHVGATYFFSKPVNSTYLLERLREMVGPGARPA